MVSWHQCSGGPITGSNFLRSSTHYSVNRFSRWGEAAAEPSYLTGIRHKLFRRRWRRVVRIPPLEAVVQPPIGLLWVPADAPNVIIRHYHVHAVLVRHVLGAMIG